ncbi:MAG: hypothetical protein M3O70_08950 [Actinomycetota bacterium]|nr:hypothetical protein [Actinomycetota bacterium]
MRDLAHRVIWTFVESLMGFLVAEPILNLLGGSVDMSYWYGALAASVASVAVVVKEAARQRVGHRQLDPMH